MKNTYVKPMMQVEEFLTNQYVAACGDTEYGKYLFKCTSAGGNLYYYPDYPASGSRPSTTASHTKLGSYNPCNKTHEADTRGSFYYGFVDRGYRKNGEEDTGEACIVYLEWATRRGEAYISNAHATDNLNQDSWETIKS